MALWRLRFWMFWGGLKDQPIKWLISVTAIALGVGLGLAVQIIHELALERFDSGVRQIGGQADLQLNPHSKLLPETAWLALLRMPEVEEASPVVDVSVTIKGHSKPVRWLGLDVFRAARTTPHLLPRSDRVDGTSVFQTQGVFLSPALQKTLNNPSQIEAKGVVWEVLGTVPTAGHDIELLVSDVAAVQWRLGTLGSISRIDIKLREGVSQSQFQNQFQAQFAQVGRLETLEQQGSRGASVSQAYRANLSILAMVALLTGGFLSFSTQMLAVAQRSRQWALLAALGFGANRIRQQLIFEAGITGGMGGLLGVALGHGLAFLILNTVGLDLGAGYFQTGGVELNVAWESSAIYLLLGLIATGLGALLPAQQASKIAVNLRLRTGSEESGLQFLNRGRNAGLVLLTLSALALSLPPWGNIPIGGYFAVAFGLFGGLSLIPSVARWAFGGLKSLPGLMGLAVSRLAATPNLLSIGLSGVVASFALVVAMHVMIVSFRTSLDEWLVAVLPAPLYLRVADGSEQPEISIAIQESLRRASGLESIQFWGQEKIILDPNKPAVDLLVRPIELEQAAQVLPMTGAVLSEVDFKTCASQTQSNGRSSIPVWVSEPFADIYGKKTGQPLTLTLDGGRLVHTCVAGVWRDYARQHGALVLPQTPLFNQYQLTFPIKQAAIWPLKGFNVDNVGQKLLERARAIDPALTLDMSQPGPIRSLSLRIFDRSFAVTYSLEVAAVLIGLFGVGTTFSAMALQRKREFALLSAMGAQSSLLLQWVIAEGFLASALAMLMGLGMGLFFAAILIEVVNPQSFHWTMGWHVPVKDLLIMCALLLAAGTLTIAMTVHQTSKSSALDQLKEDWS